MKKLKISLIMVLIMAFFVGACGMTRDIPKAAFEELATDLAELVPVKDKKLIIYNCDMSTAIGWVKWDSPEKKSYTPSDVDVYGKAVLVIDVAEGDILGITQYRWVNNSIIEYREVTITAEEEQTIKFSCEEGEGI